MKIVSLLPSATEIVYALGLGDQLAAITHECDYPPEAADKPVITSSVLDHEQSGSSSIHKGITGLLHEGKSIYHLDEELLAQIKPDLILTQELCDVCAVSYPIVQEAARILEAETDIISLEPSLLDDVLSNILLVGERAGAEQTAKDVVHDLQRRIEFVQSRTRSLKHHPRVYCMEWTAPPFAAGHWIAQMVQWAGGSDELACDGKPSLQITWQEVLDYSPEVLIVMPCGFNLERSTAEAKMLRELPGWDKLPCVKNSEVYAVDGSSYYNRPGPRLVTGLEILAQILHPDLFSFQDLTECYQRIK